jgi:hypothetical protein
MQKYYLETQEGGGRKKFLQEDKLSAGRCTVDKIHNQLLQY